LGAQLQLETAAERKAHSPPSSPGNDDIQGEPIIYRHVHPHPGMTSSQALLASALHVSVVKDFSYPSAMAYALHQCRCVCSHISPGILHPSPVATRQRDGTKGKRFLHLPAAVDHLPGAAPLVAWYGVRRSLDHSGGMAAIVVGFILTLASQWCPVLPTVVPE